VCILLCRGRVVIAELSNKSPISKKMIVSKIVLPPITEQGAAPSLRIGSLKTRSPTFLPPVLYCQRRQRLLTGMHIQASPTKEKKCPATLRTRSSNFSRSLPMLNTRAYLHLHDFTLCIIAFVYFFQTSFRLTK
jgi:hypothetical protein